MAQKSNGVVQIYIAEVLRRKGRVVKQRRGGAERCEARGGEAEKRGAVEWHGGAKAKHSGTLQWRSVDRRGNAEFAKAQPRITKQR